MIIRRLTPQHVLPAAKLHQRVLPDICALLGKAYLTKLYRLLITDSQTHYCLGAWHKKDLLGTIVLSKNAAQTHRLFHTLFSPNTLFLLIKKILLNQISLKRLVNRFIFERKVKKLLRGKYLCIVILCVRQSQQRQGIGRLLVKKAISYCQKQSAINLYVDTRRDNFRAVIFYRKMGFDLIASSFEGAVFKFNLLR